MFFKQIQEEKLIKIIEELLSYLKRSEEERLEILHNMKSFYEFVVEKKKKRKK